MVEITEKVKQIGLLKSKKCLNEEKTKKINKILIKLISNT